MSTQHFDPSYFLENLHSYINRHIWSLAKAFQAACYTEYMGDMHILQEHHVVW